jgi:hypothetical protein
MSRTCKLCTLGPCMCHKVTHRPFGYMPDISIPKDIHEFPHDPWSAMRADAFIKQLRADTRASRKMRGCDPDTGEKLRATRDTDEL